jgi:acetolactate synthase-1/2/3 large subunit
MKNNQPDYADLIVEYLKKLKVDYIFGVPGGAIEPLFDAVARAKDSNGPEIIVARHEAGAAFMAEGYTRETGKLGVCCETTGPGTTNLITGVVSAYSENIPMLVISAQTNLDKFGRNALQESSCTGVDVVSIFKHFTHFSSLVSHPDQVVNKFISAILAAYRMPCGPVHLSYPSDILRMKAKTPSQNNIEQLTRKMSLTDHDSLQELIKKINKTKRMMVFIGKDCEGAIDEIIEFAELTQSPIITNPAGKRWVNGYHPLYRGVFGFAGHISATQTVEDKTIDMIIGVGVPITEFDSGGWQEGLLNERLVHIDSKPEHFSRSWMGQHHLCGDIKFVFNALNNNARKQLEQGHRWNAQDPIRKIYRDKNTQQREHGYQIQLNEEKNCHSNAIPLKPQRVVYEFTKRIPINFRLYIDAGNVWSWFTHYFQRASSEGHYHIAMGMGSMGWAVGAAVGGSLGSGQPTICVTGDGSYLMAGQEITTALANRVPVIYVIFNDSALGMVKHGQKMAGAEQIGYKIPPVDFAKMASAMEIEGITVRTPEDLINIDWLRLAQKTAPTLIDILIDLEETPPIQQRVLDLVGKIVTE